MTTAALLGLAVLGAGECALAAWLRLRRATAAERQEKRTVFRLALFASAGLLGVLVFTVLVPMPVPPAPWEVIGMSLMVLLALCFALSEVRAAFRARHVGQQDSPTDDGR